MSQAAPPNALELSKPAEGAYALVSLSLLPNGLIGLMAVAIFAATMSSMDTALNRNAAIVTQDIYPSVCRLFGKVPTEGRVRLWIGRLLTIAFGGLVIAISLSFAENDDKGVFEIMLALGAMLGIPLAVPMMLCLFFRRVPAWAAVFSVSVALIPSFLGFYSESFFGEKWNFQTQVFLNVVTGALAFAATRLFWRGTDRAYRDRVDRFFTDMRTPVDFAREVGEGNDDVQLRLLGRFGLAIGIFIALLALVPNSLGGRVSILGIAVFVLGIAAAMLWTGWRKARPGSG